ncbi:MAG TPA: NAD(P)H-dependent glycerol-3-phosphate dehydrogenase [Gemmatimonadales bacterium]|nr:NAD(P)H-dependent glycerol-3-phosphate dehydrogenase [Gemmatimonadales bacterium]
MRIGVIGAGSWGTTVADLLVRNGHDVTIWAREADVVESIRTAHENTVFLPGVALAPALHAEATIGTAVADAELVVSAAPSHAVRTVAGEIAASLHGHRPIVVSISKGLEAGTHDRMSTLLEEVLSGCPVVALSGPSFAKEVAEHQPTAVVAASDDIPAAHAVQHAFSNAYFRVYSSGDVVGVELGGALKNVIAIAAGILDGLGLGYNPRAALITRGLAEISRLGHALGADPLTFAGLAGMGDLILTATGALSRNRSLGVELGKGRSLEEILAGRVSVAEGVRTARTAVELGEAHGVELPIAQEVSRVLFEQKDPRQAIQDLMERELKAEQWR